jgi:DNA modification methylase
VTVTILNGDCREVLLTLPDNHFDCVVTSPPYWGLRDYGVDGQIGLERTLVEHLSVMRDVFNEVRRVLKPSGTCWINYGDCYATTPNGRSAADTKAAGNDDRTFRDKPLSTVQGVLKPKDLCMVSNRLAITLQEAGWWVRSEIIWHKPNPMPESVSDLIELNPAYRELAANRVQADSPLFAEVNA